MKKLSIDHFIEKSSKEHSNKYDYTLVNYVNNKINVDIICPIHGVFSQKPLSHLKGCGCPSCGGIKASKHRQINLSDVIRKSKYVHKDKYKYDEYQKLIDNKLTILCPIHGEFKQLIYDHLKGCGCPSCSGLKKHDNFSFIEKSKTIHGEKYDYTLVDYKSYENKVKIICPIHGVFEQTPHNHLSGAGCPICFESKGERNITKLLIDNEIKYIRQHRFKDCRDKTPLPFDFYLPEHNTCVEYDGRQHFESIIKWGGETGLIDRQKKDKIKTEYCEAHNIKLIRVSYKEKINNKLIKKILS